MRGAAIGAIAAVGGCGSGDSSPEAQSAATLARWRPALHVVRVLDVAGPRSDGRLVVATDGRLALLRPGARQTPFARGPHGYSTQRGPEAYIALSAGRSVPGTGCRFPRNSVYALEPQGRRGVVVISAAGRARRFVDLSIPGLLNGIAFDATGRFGNRLLVTATKDSKTAVVAIDCRRRVRTLTHSAPALEGGIVVAPRSFGRFAGRLIAPDERSGRIWAIGPSGRSKLVAKSGLPAGGDIGVESGGFVPQHFTRAYMADRVSPGNAHPGNDALLSVSQRALLRAGVKAGDLLLASEGGAQTIAVRCHKSCTVTHVADGPATAHGEGHIGFL